MFKVAIQGIDGCFHDQAARQYFGIHYGDTDVEPVACETFSSLFRMLESDRSLVGIMAIENTIAGALLQNHELLRESDLRIVGEHKMRISHSIATLAEESLEDVKEVLSHPMALMQCDVFLESYPSIRPVEWFDTAGAARDVSLGGMRGRAAICPPLAARLYGLEVQKEGIETNKRNFTRFLILSHPEQVAGLRSKGRPINKGSIVFSLDHTKGALSKILAILSFYDMNLTKIQSMPILGREWEYRFYIDLTFDNLTRYHQALTAITPLLNDFKSLGEYAECVREV
ncbi:MAG: prephenate dehydratase [Prevotella sp.]|nr:prephenate dehydratase [Bacteroides sp.]MCM1366213.1 prephenate dehydratase [Prevotella sp.]MCM1436965.1 prephenate dehydratase [Prevotella sp.]